MSLMIGSGVIGIPFAAYKLGLILGVSLIYFTVVWWLLSMDLLFESSKLTELKSLSEIGFFWLGKSSVYIINSVIFMKSFGMPIIFFILTGTWLGQIAVKSTIMPPLLEERWPWISIAAILLLPFILK